jgi:hypothetical protein
MLQRSEGQALAKFRLDFSGIPAGQNRTPGTTSHLNTAKNAHQLFFGCGLRPSLLNATVQNQPQTLFFH